ncbi:hypothetical protein GGD62_008402 [Bradyrhizobium sp. ERR14]|nr:hypothetical protein [Bradyrhizobium sp. ERR14]
MCLELIRPASAKLSRRPLKTLGDRFDHMEGSSFRTRRRHRSSHRLTDSAADSRSLIHSARWGLFAAYGPAAPGTGHSIPSSCASSAASSPPMHPQNHGLPQKGITNEFAGFGGLDLPNPAISNRLKSEKQTPAQSLRVLFTGDSVMRVEAVEQIGWIPTQSVTEDFLLTLKLAESGWQTVYLRLTLAHGFASSASPERTSPLGQSASCPTGQRPRA